MDKKKKILAIVIPVIVILLIALIIMLIVFLLKKNGESQGEPHTTHVYVYADESDTQHRKTCSGCSEVNVLEDHTFENEQATACTNCGHIRQVSTYPYSTPTGVKLSVDKTELTAGDEFTLTIEIEVRDKDYYWDTIQLRCCPLNDAGTSASTQICQYFEIVNSYGNEGMITSLDEQFPNDVYKLCVDDFDGNYKGVCTGLSFVGDDIQAIHKIIITVRLKIKDDAPDTQTFDFGVAQKKYNYVAIKKDGNNKKYKADDEVISITVNKISMSIKAKEN